MRDAFGGVVNLAVIVVFLVIVSGYLAYNVNYTKAFKVKNRIISYFEQYGRQCEKADTDCNKKIKKYMQDIGYSTDSSFTSKDGEKATNDGTATGETGTGVWNCNTNVGYCWARFNAESNSTDVHDMVKKGYKKVYYKVATRINMDIPIINRIMPNIFEVTGATKQIAVKSS